jgi:hypothetical protein
MPTNYPRSHNIVLHRHDNDESLLTGWLAAETSDSLEVGFDELERDVLRLGSVLEFETNAGRLLPAQVIAVQSGDPGAAVLRPLIVAGGADGRQDQRVVTVLPLETPVMAMSNGRLTACKVVLIDLSAGGAGLIAPKVLDIGTVIGINPPLFDGMPDIDIAAEVVWQTRLGHFWRIGTRFTGVTSEQQERLLRRVSAEERRWINTMDSWG